MRVHRRPGFLDENRAFVIKRVEFLVAAYGTEPMKNFNRLSRATPRPWKEAFGGTLEELETQWLEAVRSKSRDREDIVSAILNLLKSPETACFKAQALAREEVSRQLFRYLYGRRLSLPPLILDRPHCLA